MQKQVEGFKESLLMPSALNSQIVASLAMSYWETCIRSRSDGIDPQVRFHVDSQTQP